MVTPKAIIGEQKKSSFDLVGFQHQTRTHFEEHKTTPLKKTEKKSMLSLSRNNNINV